MKRKDTVTIPLAHPLASAGRSLDSLTLRRPTVGDHIAAQENAAGDLSREVALFSRLSGVNPEDLAAMDWADYQEVQQGYLSLFRGGDAPAPAAPGGAA